MAIQNCGFSDIIGPQKSMRTKKNNFVGTQICGGSKIMDNQNLLINKICGLSNVGYQK